MGNNRVAIQESVVISYSCGSCCQKFELSGVHNSNKKVQDLIDRLGKEIKDRSDGRDYSSLKAIRYRTQFMLGTNYFIKARTHNGKFAHLRVYVPLDGGRPELYGLRHDMRADQEISYF